MTRTLFGKKCNEHVANRKLHVSVGFEDRRPEWVDGEAEEIHQAHEMWPSCISAETHRAWWLPATGEVWTHMRPDLRRLRALTYHENVSPDTMTPEQKRELAKLRGVAAPKFGGGGGQGTPRLSADDVRAIRKARGAGASCHALAVQYGVSSGYIYDLVSRRSRAEVK